MAPCPGARKLSRIRQAMWFFERFPLSKDVCRMPNTKNIKERMKCRFVGIFMSLKLSDSCLSFCLNGSVQSS